MALEKFDKVGSGSITDMTEDFCTYEIEFMPIAASGLQTFLEEGWEQTGNVVEVAINEGTLYIYNFRNVSNV
jgi:hypothetical protein